MDWSMKLSLSYSASPKLELVKLSKSDLEGSRDLRVIS